MRGCNCLGETYTTNNNMNAFTSLYHDRNHLGNVRQVTKASNSNGTVVQTMNYYPFGAQFCDGSAASGDVQPYKYNGKELDKMHGLNTYDYGARQYNPVTARWDRMDPLAEKYYSVSPYVYCLNNPIRLIDPDGKAPGDFFSTIDDAAKDFGLFYNDNSIRINREMSSLIFEVKDNFGNKGFSYSIANIGDKELVLYKGELGAKNVALIHTHGAYDSELGEGNDLFSGSFTAEKYNSEDENKSSINNKDIGIANKRGMNSYLVTPSGSLQKYDPHTGKISVISNDMPSDINDPYRINEIGTDEKDHITLLNLMQMQENINNGILNNRIK